MQNDESIVRYTADEINEMARRGQDQTDYDRVQSLTEAELEASIDSREAGEFDWDAVQIGMPEPKRQLTVRFDGDVIDWFKAQGPGYQTRMNAVLRGYVAAQKRYSA
jgi:uncharacterized protein (DUF4415 family)